MDVQGLESEAQSAIAGASTLDELDDARVRYLGRKSDLKQALREVRDPESGRILNTLREQLERAVAEREAALSGQEDPMSFVCRIAAVTAALGRFARP